MSMIYSPENLAIDMYTYAQMKSEKDTASSQFSVKKEKKAQKHPEKLKRIHIHSLNRAIKLIAVSTLALAATAGIPFNSGTNQTDGRFFPIAVFSRNQHITAQSLTQLRVK